MQETLLAAWRGLEGFEGRASLRAWLYRIATNRCLNALRDAGAAAGRRHRAAVRAARADPPRRADLAASPTPTRCSSGSPTTRPGPRRATSPARRSGSPSSPALQRLPPRQRAALVLRDVLGLPRRRGRRRCSAPARRRVERRAAARARVARASAAPDARPRAAARTRPREREVAAALRRRLRRGRRRRRRRAADRRRVADHAARAASSTTGARRSRPSSAGPAPTCARGGRDAPARARRARTASRRSATTCATRSAAGARPGLMVLTLDGRGAITAITRFGDAALLARFGLPPSVRR